MLRKGIYVFTFLAIWMSKNVEMHQMAEEINGQSISLYQKLCSQRGHTFFLSSSSEFYSGFLAAFSRFSNISSKNIFWFPGWGAYLVCPRQLPIPILIDRATLLCALQCTLVLESYIPVAAEAEAVWYTFHMALHCTVVTASELHCAALCIWWG